jgi:exonuclease VII small subunit
MAVEFSEYEEVRENLLNNKHMIERYTQGTNISKQKQKELDIIESKLNYLRPEKEDDMLYRIKQYNEFSERVAELPNSLPLWFHGCPIYTAQKILEDGEITSEYSRLGFGHDNVYLTTKDVIDVTVKKYINLLDFTLPVGCIFVLNLGNFNQSEILVDKVDFRQNPDQLFSIVTSLENIDMLKEWARENNVDLTKILDFENFLELFNNNLSNDETKPKTI